MMVWEKIESAAGPKTCRTQVPGGWLVFASIPLAGGLTFYADPDHEWTGDKHRKDAPRKESAAAESTTESRGEETRRSQ